MDWIKKHYDQFALAVAALALLALSVFLILRASSFGESFEAAQAPTVPSEKIPELDAAPLKTAQRKLDQPSKWEKGTAANGFMFVPDLHLIDESGLPKKPGVGTRHIDSLTRVGIPNSWFLSNKLQLLSATVPKDDPDGDGFTNEDEWRGDREGEGAKAWGGPQGASTNPNDKASHPPYHTKLFLKQWIRVRFRLLFQAYDGDPKKPKEMTFQINAVDRGRRTEFLKLGEKVGNTPYRLEKFELKTLMNDKTGVEDDVSELTVMNTETQDSVALVLAKETDSPDSYGLFEYQWNNKPIQVKRLGEFALLPESDKRYKLIDIKEGEALIQLPDGRKYIVIPDPRSR
jgi:hypothetical protein